MKQADSHGCARRHNRGAGRFLITKLNLFLLGLTLASIAVAQDSTRMALAKARTELHRAVQEGKVAGAVHLVVRDGKTMLSEAAGFSDTDGKEPFKPDSILRIYSMTKPITSVSAMTLFEQGRFKLDDPVALYLPAFSNATVLQKSGEKHTYGYNTDLLGRLIEVWSGKTLDVYLRESVLAPLEMADTGFTVPADKRSRFTACVTARDGKLTVLDPAVSSPFHDNFEFLSGGGGLVSTVGDYAIFCQMLVDSGQFKGRRLLKPETLKLMFTDQLNGVAGSFQFGLGFAIAEVQLGSGEARRKAMQYSWGGYASTEFRIVPAERLIQIFARQQIPYTQDQAKKQFAIVYEALAAPPSAPAPTPVP